MGDLNPIFGHYALKPFPPTSQRIVNKPVIALHVPSKSAIPRSSFWSSFGPFCYTVPLQ
jgi:hypothetical protein